MGKIIYRVISIAIISLVLISLCLQTVKAEEGPCVYVIVNSTLVEDLQFYLDRYTNDLERIGLRTRIVLFRQGNHSYLKEILVNAFLKEDLIGCLMIGDLPIAYYEDWKINNETYPTDLYYCDLNGNWSDTDANGIYDLHQGDRKPEIWVGRIKASGLYLPEDEVSLIKRYFDKNHSYRIGTLALPEKALVYIDDDWVDSSYSIKYAVSLAYSDSNITLVDEKTVTRADDYLNRLGQGWNLVQLKVHGNIGFHHFWVNGQDGGYIESDDIWKTDPKAFFYNLGTCFASRYSSRNYLAGSYLFSSYGLAVVGLTNEGGMWYTEDFYKNFRNETLGFSFKKWLTNRVAEEDATPGTWYNWSWYYGIVILGDPTLSRKPDRIEIPEEKIDVAITNISPTRTIVSNYLSTFIEVIIENQGTRTEIFDVALFANQSQIGTQTVTLFGSQSKVLTFRWNTIGLSLGRYTISGYISPVPNETEIMDNEFVDGWIVITIPGDINADGTVNILDIAKAARAFGSYPGYLKWDSNADVNEDKMINIIDLALIAKEYGKTA